MNEFDFLLILNLYHQDHARFLTLDDVTKEQFYTRLYRKG